MNNFNLGKMQIGKLEHFVMWFLLLITYAEANRVIIFTSDKNSFPNIHNFLYDYGFGMNGLNIEVHKVADPQ